MRASMSAGGVSSGADQAAKALDRFGKQARQTARDVSTLKTIEIGELIGSGISAATNAFQNAGRAALSYATNVANAADYMNDLAARTGIGVEALQSLQMAGKLSGVDDITGAVQKLAVAIGNAAASGETSAFTNLGLDFEQLQAMSPEEQFKAIQAAIAALPTEAERAAAAVKIFGKAGVELLPLMSQNLAEVEQRMRRLGAIIGADQVEAIASMNDALDMVKATFDGIIGQVVGNLAPVVESMANDLLGFVENFNSASGATGGSAIAESITQTIFDGLNPFIDAVGMAGHALITLGELIAQIVAKAAPVFGVSVDSGAAKRVRELEQQIYATENLNDPISRMLLGVTKEQQETDLKQLRSALAMSKQKAGNENPTSVADSARQALDAGIAAAKNASATANARFNDPAEKKKRDDLRKQKEEDAKAARQLAVAKEKRRKAEEQLLKDLQANSDKAAKEALDATQKAEREDEARRNKRKDEIDRKKDEAANAAEFLNENTTALRGKSNEALKANDIRSSEGMSQFLALASGREDPAIAEYRKQSQKLHEIVAALHALQQQPADILGGAAA